MIEARSIDPAVLDRQGFLAATVREPIGFTAVVLSHGDPVALGASLRGLRSQTWPHWRAVVADSSGPPSLSPEHAADPRIHCVHQRDPMAAVNALIEQPPSRDFVVLVRAGDVLDPRCLFEAMSAAYIDPLVDLVYWDDDLLLADGSTAPRVRPSWSPAMLLAADWVGTSFALRHRRLVYAGGVRTHLGEAAVWDLLLRSGLDEERVARLPISLATVRRRNDLATENGRAAVDDWLHASAWPARARLDRGTVLVDWELERWPAVTLVVPTRHNRPLIGNLLAGLAATDYDDLELVVVDNGPASDDNRRWYAEQNTRFALRVHWWDRPFNYSAVNNLGAADARGEVLVFLNDDIEVVGARWLRDLVGWTMRDGAGVTGAQLTDGSGRIQHGGVVIGPTGFADHLFTGLRPGIATVMGSTRWYRDLSAVTGACMAMRREVFDTLGGFDEQLQLCGSDVSLCLAARIRRYSTMCTAAVPLRHLESATRGDDAIPVGDFHASYWRYQPWIHGGDPYFSPRLSMRSGVPQLRIDGEPDSLAMIGPVLGRSFATGRPHDDLDSAHWFAHYCRSGPEDQETTRRAHQQVRGRHEPRTVTWFIPGLDSPFYGGINTVFRIADMLARRHGVVNSFVVSGEGPAEFIAAGMAAAFPGLHGSAVRFLMPEGDVDDLPECDVAVATLWTTAYQVARFSRTKRRFYLVQDFEPMFYPAGSIYALAEESYRLGLYGICNTDNLRRIYESRYGGRAMSFSPAVDTSVFHAQQRMAYSPDAPTTLMVYARPGHWRNCWELASLALVELKERMGDHIRILAAGSWMIPEETGHLDALKHLGLLDYRATGELYRRCDVGLALTVSEHPSYLPLELMACGAAVVAFDNPAGHWLLRHEENCLLTSRTVDGLVDGLERMATNPPLRRALSDHALLDVAAHHADWDAALAGIFEYLSDPERATTTRPPRRQRGVPQLRAADALAPR